jgi:hypothetical protein
MRWLECLGSEYEIQPRVGEECVQWLECLGRKYETQPRVVEEYVQTEEQGEVEEDSEVEDDTKKFSFADVCNANDRHEFEILEIEERECLQHTFIRVDEEGIEERFIFCLKEERLEDASLFVSRKLKIHTGRRELVVGDCAWSLKRKDMEKLIPWLMRKKMDRYVKIR